MSRLRKSATLLLLLADSEDERALIAFGQREGALTLRDAVYPISSEGVILPPAASDALIAQIDQAFREAARAHAEAASRRERFRVL